MNKNQDKSKFNEALVNITLNIIQKLYDNREYKAAKKACDKLLDKSPSNPGMIYNTT